RTCRTLHDSDRLRDRGGRSDVALRRHPRYRQYRRSKAAKAFAGIVPAAADQYPPRLEAEPADLSAHGRLRPFWPLAGKGRRGLVGTNGSCRFAEARLALNRHATHRYCGVVPAAGAFAIPRQTEEDVDRRDEPRSGRL